MGEGLSGSDTPSLAAFPPQLAAAVSNACAAVSHNLNGQKLGRKGRVTRERILAAAIELIEARDEPFTLSAVAARASLGMTSLYNYFTDLTELLLAILEPVMASAEESYLAFLREPWPDDRLYDSCYQFVRRYLAFWQRHSRLLHMRNALADQQDERMMGHRVKSTQPIIALLVQQMDSRAQTAWSPISAMATMVMIGVERSVTIVTSHELRRMVKMPEHVNEDRYLISGARLMEFAIRDARQQHSLTNGTI